MDDSCATNSEELSVDVVVATRDRAEFLKGCLKSIREQTYQPRSVIVVDDGSIDGTPDVLDRLMRDWPQLTVISVRRGGVSAARNAALRVASSELVAFKDDDDLWLPDMLERQVALFRNRPQIGFAYCGFRELDAEGNDLVNGHRVIPINRGDIFSHILDRFQAIAISTLLVRRSLLQEIGGFDEALAQAEDRDLCLAIARRSETDFNSDVLVGLRKHPAGAYSSAMRRDPEFVLLQRLAVWNKWRSDFGDPGAILDRFRAEAAAVAIHLLARPLPDVGLYGRLRNSNLALARELFPSRLSYLAAIFAWFGIGHLRGSAGTSLPDQLKEVVARRIILPNPALLSLARRLGKFKDPGNSPSPLN